MKGNLVFVLLLVVLGMGCSTQAARKPPKFSLEKGTVWAYLYDAYEPSADPDQTMKATYRLTETVVETETKSPYFVAHVEREYTLMSADAGWNGDFSEQQKEFWYVIDADHVLRSNQPVDRVPLNVDELILDYDFPLSVAKTWCLSASTDTTKPTSCEFVGRREVTSQGPYEGPMGKFDDCYQVTEYWNTGNFFQTFCNGIGVVSMKFDHPGTRFGFEQTLTGYTRGTP
jgi:hypothetical protein